MTNIDTLGGNYEVCLCKQTTLQEILTAIKNGSHDLEAIGDATEAGTACEYCTSRSIDKDGEKDVHLDEILVYTKQKGLC